MAAPLSRALFGNPAQTELDTLREGITIDGIHYGPIIARVDREQGANAWLTMDLREGKNREIKRVLEHLGFQVSRLIRISFGPFQLSIWARGRLRRCARACWPNSLAKTRGQGRCRF